MWRCLVRWMTVILWMGGIFMLSAIPSFGLPPASAYAGYDHPLRKFAHVLEYAGLTLLLYRAFRLHVHRPSQAWLLAGLVAALYAASDEWHQTLVPGRDGTARDVAIDGIGVIGACLLSALRGVQETWRRRRAEGARLYSTRQTPQAAHNKCLFVGNTNPALTPLSHLRSRDSR
jgi:VanZ family protein